MPRTLTWLTLAAVGLLLALIGVVVAMSSSGGTGAGSGAVQDDTTEAPVSNSSEPWFCGGHGACLDP